MKVVRYSIDEIAKALDFLKTKRCATSVRVEIDYMDRLLLSSTDAALGSTMIALYRVDEGQNSMLLPEITETKKF